MTPRTAPDPLAPHVERAWLDAFVVELRLRDVPGDRIGDAVAEVDSHCAESGEGAVEAFGDPVAYARSLGLAPLPGADGEVRRVVAGVAAQLVGMVLVPTAVAALARGDRVGVTAGVLVAVLLGLAAAGGLAIGTDRVLRLVLDRPVVAWACLMAACVAVALPAVLWRSTLLELPAGVVAGAGLVALVAGVVVERRALGAPDPVVVPEAAGGTDARPAGRAAVGAAAFLVPAATVVLAAASWFAAR